MTIPAPPLALPMLPGPCSYAGCSQPAVLVIQLMSERGPETGEFPICAEHLIVAIYYTRRLNANRA